MFFLVCFSFLLVIKAHLVQTLGGGLVGWLVSRFYRNGFGMECTLLQLFSFLV